MRQDSIVGVPLPAPLGALYRDLMSPYCPGLSLASCPSPQADSLRSVIAERFERGESPEMITTALVADYGPGIRGSPTLDGFGSMAFVMPALMLVAGAVAIQRWLRRSRQPEHRRDNVALMLLLCTGLLGQTACSADNESTAQTAAGAAAGQAGGDTTPLPTTPWVSGAWVRAGAADAVVGGYATLHNPTSAPVEVVGATSPAADTVEIHETVDHDGMVHMEAQRTLIIPAGDSVQLAPGGLHLMIRGLTSALSAGDSLTLELRLSSGEALRARAEVRPIGARAADATAPAALDTGRNVDSVVAAILACPRDGLWHGCSLELRFQQFGLRAAERDTVAFIPGVPQPARTWVVGGRTLRAVLLDSTTAGALAATFDSARAAPAADPSVVWPERATLLHNANLLAIYFGGTDRQVERITNAILGGPPQPDPARPPAR